jgi:hypothetical protein
VLADLAVSGGYFAHPSLGLGCVGNREVCEESHGRLLSNTGY